jgi:hypothetical protein
MEQRIFILILIIFLLSSNFSKVFEDIINSFFYLILILSILKIINPSIQKRIIKNITIFIDTDNYSMKFITGNIASRIKSFIIGKSNSKINDLVPVVSQTSSQNVSNS